MREMDTKQNGNPGHVDAAFHDERSDTTYFFKGMDILKQFILKGNVVDILMSDFVNLDFKVKPNSNKFHLNRLL